MKPDLTLVRGRRVCAALSGGGDSVALFHFLWECAASEGIELSAVHVEHGIRGADSLADAAFVRALCEERKVPLRLASVNVPARAAEWGTGMEEAARRCRYEVFARLLGAGEADVVVTAHHAGDNAESVLFNLFRGASLTGAGGIRAFVPYAALARFLPKGEMPPRPADCGVARPLLGVAKREIAAYLQEHALAWREDATNADPSFTRNFLRTRVLAPAREKFPAADRALYAFSRRAREDDEYLYALARAYVEPSVYRGAPAYAVRPCPRPLFLRACVCALRGLGVERDYGLADLEAAHALWEGGSGRRARLPQGVVAVRAYEKIFLYRSAQAREKILQEYPFAEGEFVFADLRLRVRMLPPGAPLPARAFVGAKEERTALRVLALDPARLPPDCVLRTRREGDVFRKFGGGTKKLKDFFIDRKLPRPLRDAVPLLACGSEVLAVCGVEISGKVRLSSAKTAGEGGACVLELTAKGE